MLVMPGIVTCEPARMLAASESAPAVSSARTAGRRGAAGVPFARPLDGREEEAEEDRRGP